VLNQAGFYGIKRAIAFKKAKDLLFFFGLWEKRFDVSMSLSGGMKRRLMIVRSLIHDPEILVLDEPTAGVDILWRSYSYSHNFSRIQRSGCISYWKIKCEFTVERIGTSFPCVISVPVTMLGS